jgi:hypothetical protein
MNHGDSAAPIAMTAAIPYWTVSTATHSNPFVQPAEERIHHDI